MSKKASYWSEVNNSFDKSVIMAWKTIRSTVSILHPGAEVLDVKVPIHANVSAWPTHPTIAGDGAPARVLFGRQS
jgi:hypothetical protein